MTSGEKAKAKTRLYKDIKHYNVGSNQFTETKEIELQSIRQEHKLKQMFGEIKPDLEGVAEARR